LLRSEKSGVRYAMGNEAPSGGCDRYKDLFNAWGGVQ
jgi:hypothetical protein